MYKRQAEYIATREGVELIEAPHPTHDGGGYLEYMAQRPRSHGLFSAEGPADLEKTMAEINGHTGPVWTFVYSLKREDAHRLGYENSESWRKLLLAHQTELAQAMKISPSSFRWRAAFHDEKHHPHIHMMVWSADPKQGYLTEKGIEKMRSQLSNEIFRDELLSLYQKKDLSYQQVRDAAREAMGRLIQEMETGLCHSPVIAEQMETLAGKMCIRDRGHGVGQTSDPHFDPHRFIAFCNKKSPKTEVFGDFWSCYPDLNWGPHPYQAPPELFSNYFSCFIAISAPIHLLSVTL